MEKGKIAAALTVIAILCTTLTYALTLQNLNNGMHIAGIKTIRIEKPEGTVVTNFDWGTFTSIGESKTETFWVHNVGNNLLSFNINCTDLPAGWNLNLSQTGWLNVAVNQSITFSATLTLLQALPEGNYGFTLYFQE